jgi:serine/threonine protein kinase
MSSKSQPEHAFQGKTIARCRVGERLGRGRTSHVFKAFYEPLQKDIALKILSGDLANEAEIRASFLKEAQTVARLDHEHIVKVLDVVEDQDCLCILMEYVAGETLQDRLSDSGPLPPRKAARIATQVANALEAAHAEKVLHRDIKPANIILTKGSDQVKVVDFGLAGSGSLANRAGTPLYMSPEACQGKRVDEKTDVYALGVCLFQMLTGELPFKGDSVKEILQAHIGGELTPASAVNKDLGSEFDGVLKKLLVKSKGYRPTASEAVALLAPHFKDDLSGTKPDRRAGGGRRGASAGRRGAASRPTARAQKSKAPIVIGVVLIVVVIAAVAMFAMNDKGSVNPDSAQNPANGGSSAQNTNTVPVAPAPAQVDPGQVALVAAMDWAKSHADDLSGQIAKFKQVEAAHAGTDWAKKAANQRQELEQKIKSAADADLRNQKKAAEAKVALEKRQKLNDVCAVFDFTKAAEDALEQKNLPDESYPAWEARKRRLAYLSDHLVNQLNAGLGGCAQPLNKLDPASPAIREINGCTREGFQWTDGSLSGVKKWAELKGKQDRIYDLAKRLISQSDAEGNLLLAVLAAELWFDQGEDHKFAKMFREMVELTDDVGGSAAKKLQRLFAR